MRVGTFLVFALNAAYGASTANWEMNTYADFVRGRFQGVSLSRDGRLSLAPQMDTLFTTDQPMVWSLAPGPNGSIYAATGHRGRIFRIDKTGASSVLWTAEQPEVFAIVADSKGALYAGTSPNGKVYRIENGKAAEYFAPGAKYIWALALGRDGSLYVGTGDGGRVFRVTAAGQGDVYYETDQAHITSLSFDPQGHLLAGSEPNGMLYRITAKDKAFVLYDATLPEIRAIATAADGTIYAAALGGSVAKRAQAAQTAQAGAASPAVSTTTTTITVTADVQAGAPEIKPQEAAKTATAAAAATPAASTSPVVDLTGVEKSAVYRINPDNSVETLWSSKDENIYDLLDAHGQILFSTDGNGRIYRLSPDRKVTLVSQTNQAEATRLLMSGGSLLAATGNMGRVYRLGDAPGASGTYESPVHDASSVARWGRLTWRAELAANTSLQFQTRSGNSARPDKTWSDWSAPITDPAKAAIASPNSRYIQWRAEFRGPGGATPVLNNVGIAYLPQNNAPVVKSITVMAQLATVSAKATAQVSGAAATVPYTITVTDTGDSGPVTSAGTPTQALSRAAAQQINISWLAEDPDGDRLAYSLFFRGEDESEWKLLKSGLHETSFNIDGDALADGRYLFRVVASDRESNAGDIARETELTSAPVLIDNTPPVVTVVAPRRSGAIAEIDFDAVDAASPLRRCEYSLDAGSWIPVSPADGVIDSPRERFHLKLENLTPGEHVLVLRAVDSANNPGLAKIVLH